ncbi:hypothetical protein BH24PSE2_BH24PSE2_08680 [soil metagenome]
MTRGDLCVLVLGALVVGATYGAFWRGDGPGAYAVVRSGGESVARYALAGHRAIEIPGRLGPSVLAIEPGRIRFTASPCRRKVCVHAGWQQRGGSAAACVPNAVSIEVIGAERLYDSINF